MSLHSHGCKACTALSPFHGCTKAPSLSKQITIQRISLQIEPCTRIVGAISSDHLLAMSLFSTQIHYFRYNTANVLLTQNKHSDSYGLKSQSMAMPVR